MLVVVVECCNGDNAFATEAFRSLTKFVLLIPFPGTRYSSGVDHSSSIAVTVFT
jgi:hypothetical protein